ncbi:MAG: hypothetical protein IIZ75_09030, partial [Lachnospiraceae bacterium]|nr:hypothetical protein [Lachnospiraceae bacterium]
MQEFDALIVITGKDYDRVHKNYPRLFKYLPARDIIFIGNDEVAERLERDSAAGLAAPNARFMDENDVLPFEEIDAVM